MRCSKRLLPLLAAMTLCLVWRPLSPALRASTEPLRPGIEMPFWAAKPAFAGSPAHPRRRISPPRTGIHPRSRVFVHALKADQVVGENLCVRPEAHIPLICIDPGHSKATVGAHGKKAVEYKVVWQVAQRLKIELERLGLKAILTKRTQDENVRNEDRAAAANRAGADLLLRLHCDAGTDSGVATFFPDRQGEKDGVRGPSRAVIAASRRCAVLFHPAMIRALDGALPDRGVRPDIQTNIGGKQGALTGSIFSRVPVLLVEMAVLTNPKDETFIASERGQRLMARALAKGAEAAVKRRKEE